jgi:transposase InsO family protein
MSILEGWLYLVVILELFGRRIVGWEGADRQTSVLNLTDLRMAIQLQRPSPGLIYHSEQGSQYNDKNYQAVLAVHSIQASMNGIGTWYDTPMESFFGTSMSERVHLIIYATRDQASPDVF